MREFFIKRYTLISLTILSILEIIFVGQIEGSGILWFAYGVYKILLK